MVKTLTPKQKEAVESTAKATLVIAGPGTGKTHILASRIAHLIKKQGVAPENILALTFTKSGAKEMKDRAISFVGADGYNLTANTFHGFAASLIEDYPDIFGYHLNVKQLSDIDRITILERIFNELAKREEISEIYNPDDSYYIKAIADAITTIKLEGFTPEDFMRAVEVWQKEFDNLPDEEKLSSRGPRKGQIKREFETELRTITKNYELARVYKRYQEELAKQSRYDYEDMILRVVTGLERDASVRAELHSRYKAILVDEYQDTSGAQNKLLFLLIGDNTRVFIVGDDDQAIYRFQGATVQNFLTLKDRLPKTTVITLEDNFRSPQMLIDAALKIAHANPDRLTKRLGLPDKVLHARGQYKNGTDININSFETEEHEHSFIIDSIQELHKNGSNYSDIAIITLTNKEQEEFAELLRQNNIPISLSGDVNALKNPHVATLFSFAAACMNPLDSHELLTLLLHPATPIAREDVFAILELRNRKETLFAAMRRAPASKLANKKDFQKTYNIIATLAEKQTTLTGAQWLKEVLEDTGLLAWSLTQKDAPYIIANFRTLTDEAKRVQAGNPLLSIFDLMEHFRSHTRLEIPLKPKLAALALDNTVSITTAHKVKGKEFAHVFMVHTAHGHWSGKRRRSGFRLPSSVAVPIQDASDERRLFYVAMTRAKQQLFITFSRTYTRGFSGTEDDSRQVHPALFIEELSDHVPSQSKTIDVGKGLHASLSPITLPNNQQKEIIKRLVAAEGFALNATKLNSFLECPKRFLYDHVLRVPKIKTFSLTYGEAVHLALQRYFESPKKKRTVEGLMETVERHLRESSILTDSQNKRIAKRARDMFETYHPKLAQEPEPVAVEYLRSAMNIGDMRVSGKIDKIAPLKNNGVKVVDYKTSKAKTLNAILGKTKDTYAPNLMRQLLFYKLLLEHDSGFKYHPEAFALDFVDANKEVAVPINEQQYKKFQTQLKNVWKSIQTLAFLESSPEFPHCGECEYCELLV